jgi:GTPase Era involved in 16S rRNA processing
MPRRILIVGSTGQGKSSLINTLTGQRMAEVSSSANGTTFESALHVVEHGGEVYELVDTVGLNETGKVATVKAGDALLELNKLLLDASHNGYNLIILVHKGKTSDSMFSSNYNMFVERMMKNALVPIIFVKTGIDSPKELDPGHVKYWPEQEVNRAAMEAFPRVSATVPACCGGWNDEEDIHGDQMMSGLRNDTHKMVGALDGCKEESVVTMRCVHTAHGVDAVN